MKIEDLGKLFKLERLNTEHLPPWDSRSGTEALIFTAQINIQ